MLSSAEEVPGMISSKAGLKYAGICPEVLSWNSGVPRCVLLRFAVLTRCHATMGFCVVACCIILSCTASAICDIFSRMEYILMWLGYICQNKDCK